MTMIEPQLYPFTIKGAGSEGFCAYVNKLIQSNIGEFEANVEGNGRKFLKMDYVSPSGDPVLFAMKQQLAQYFKLGAYVVPPALKDFLSYITEGGFIHAHTDPDLPGRRHVRINLIVSQTRGCAPLMEDIPITVSTGDAWLNLASKVKHATTPVEGPGYRSAISFGYQIDPRRGDELYEIHEAWAKAARGHSHADANIHSA